MSKPRIVAFVLFVVVVLGTGASYRWVHRLSRHTELEHAAANFCACMLGHHTGDVTQTLDGVRVALDVDPDEAHPWPQRCQPYAGPASDAMNAAWRAGVEGAPDETWGDVAAELGKGDEKSATKILEALQPFWVGEPVPTVPIAPRPQKPLIDESTPRFFDGSMQFLQFGDEEILISGFGPKCTIDDAYRASCAPITYAFVLERDPDAPKNVAIAPPLPEASLLVWAHVYAGGRIVAVDRDGTILELDHGKLASKKFVIQTQQRSTRFLASSDGTSWAVWKDTTVTPAIAVAWKLSDGVRGNRIPIGVVARPGAFDVRTYGTCRARATWVDLDPNIAVLSDGKWTMLERAPAPNGRHIDCVGDSAILTEYHPPDVQRCTSAGSCTPVPLPALAGNTEDELLATESTLYHLQRGAIDVLSIRDLASGSARRIPLTAVHDQKVYRPHGALHVSHGHVLLTIVRSADLGAYVLAVEADGTTRMLRAGE